MLHSVLLWNLVSKIVSFKKIPSVNCKRTHSQYRIPHVNTQETVHFDFDDMRTDEIVTDRLRNRMSNRVESKSKSIFEILKNIHKYFCLIIQQQIRMPLKSKVEIPQENVSADLSSLINLSLNANVVYVIN
jgi:hypothetical protein